MGVFGSAIVMGGCAVPESVGEVGTVAMAANAALLTLRTTTAGAVAVVGGADKTDPRPGWDGADASGRDRAWSGVPSPVNPRPGFDVLVVFFVADRNE